MYARICHWQQNEKRLPYPGFENLSVAVSFRADKSVRDLNYSENFPFILGAPLPLTGYNQISLKFVGTYNIFFMPTSSAKWQSQERLLWMSGISIISWQVVETIQYFRNHYMDVRPTSPEVSLHVIIFKAIITIFNRALFISSSFRHIILQTASSQLRIKVKYHAYLTPEVVFKVRHTLLRRGNEARMLFRPKPV